MPRPWSREDCDSIELLKSYLKGGTPERRGTLQSYIEHIQVASNPDCVDFPRFHQDIQLRTLGHGSYNLVFNYLRQAWSEKFELISDIALATCSQASFLGVVKSFTHVWVSKRRYGAGEYSRGISARYAYIDTRVPVLIDYIFRCLSLTVQTSTC